MREFGARDAVGVPGAHRREIEIEGMKLSYWDQGKGHPVVCLHAVGHGARDFEALFGQMSGVRLLALDWPGQGGSDPAQEPPSTKHYARLVSAFIDQLGLDAPVLLGNSIGGGAAIELALSSPEKASGLVLCDTGGLHKRGWLARVAIGLIASFFAQGRKKRRWFGWAFRRYYQMVLPAEAAASQRERIIASGYEIAPLLEAAWRGFGDPSTDLRDVVSGLSCPVWFAWSKADKTLALRDSIDGIRRVRDHSLDLFPGGHAAFLEAPDLFIPEFEAWLVRHGWLPPSEDIPRGARS